MTKINPNELTGARTYFTGFDNKSYVTKDKSKKEEILERTLKVLLLTKNTIVFGASHLKSDLALNLLDKEPKLFEKGIIIPALRNEHNGDLAKATGNNQLQNNIFNKYVGWDLEDNTSWFKEQIKLGFQNEKSLLRNNLIYTQRNDIEKIINYINSKDYFDRETSNDKLKKMLNQEDLKSFDLYQNMVYNISGARVVNCESSLDQENMIYDYSLSDIENKKIFLSDIEIFHRMFVEQIFNSMNQTTSAFDINFLDALKFEDILDLREKIDSTNFINKYNELILKSSLLVEKRDFIDFHSLEELIAISNEIHKNFKQDIEQEAEKYLKTTNQYIKDKSIWEPIYNINKSILIDMTAGVAYDIGKNLIYLARNIYNVISNKQENLTYQNQLKYQDEIAKKLLENTQIDNGTSLIEVLKLLNQYKYEKYENF